MKIVEVIIWDKLVGVLVWDEANHTTSFEFSKSFINTNLQLSPLISPLSTRIIKAKIDFNDINSESMAFDTEKGLPLFISDSLPDKFGTDLFAKYLEKEGKNYRTLTPIEKLTYIGSRGMGALEFRPALHIENSATQLDLKKLNQLSASLINNEPIGNLSDMGNLFHVGTSPGGAQPKVLINIDKENGNIYRGDNLPTTTQEGWILKFNRDTGLEIDKERGKIEYAYYLMAKKSGISITDSELKEIDGDYFFMTKRFDRENGQKLHTQTLHAFAGMNFKSPNTYSYEQLFTVFNSINLDYGAKEQLFRIMVFNVIGRNVDDHTKNFGFNMNNRGVWQFSPAYDLTFSYNENYNRTVPHFLSVNGKNEDFSLNDILTVAKEYSIKNPKKIINEINHNMLQWNKIATGLNISATTIDYIASKLNTFPYGIK
jgi:serine/threonine-protein kinase HipA